MEAEGGNDDQRKKLIGAAKLLAEATTKMVEAAKVGKLLLFGNIFSLNLSVRVRVSTVTGILMH